MHSQEKLHQQFQEMMGDYFSYEREMLEIASLIEKPHLRLGLDKSPIAMCLEPGKFEYEWNLSQLKVVFELLKKTEPLIECRDGKTKPWLNLVSEMDHETAVKILRSEILELVDLNSHFIDHMDQICAGYTFSKSLTTCLSSNVTIPRIMDQIEKACIQADVETMDFINQYGFKIQTSYLAQMLAQGWDVNQHNDMELICKTEEAMEMLEADNVADEEFEIDQITPLGYAAYMGNANMMANLIKHGAIMEREDHLIFGESGVKWGIDKINKIGHLNYPGTVLPTDIIIRTHKAASSASLALDELLATKKPPAP